MLGAENAHFSRGKWPGQQAPRSLPHSPGACGGQAPHSTRLVNRSLAKSTPAMPPPNFASHARALRCRCSAPERVFPNLTILGALSSRCGFDDFGDARCVWFTLGPCCPTADVKVAIFHVTFSLKHFSAALWCESRGSPPSKLSERMWSEPCRNHKQKDATK